METEFKKLSQSKTWVLNRIALSYLPTHLILQISCSKYVPNCKIKDVL